MWVVRQERWQKGDIEVPAADEEGTSGLGIFFQLKNCLKTQAGVFCSVTANFQPPSQDLCWWLG